MVKEPELIAALIAAAYRTIHLSAIRRLLDGAAAETVAPERAEQLARAFAVVEPAIAQLQSLGASAR